MNYENTLSFCDIVTCKGLHNDFLRYDLVKTFSIAPSISFVDGKAYLNTKYFKGCNFKLLVVESAYSSTKLKEGAMSKIFRRLRTSDKKKDMQNQRAISYYSTRS